MKNLRIAFKPLLFVCIALMFNAAAATAANITKKYLEGIWQQCDAQGYVLKSDGYSQHKVFTPTQFIVITVNEEKDNVVVIYTGVYDVKKDIYEEILEKCTPGYENTLKTVNTYKIEEVADDRIHIVGSNNRKYDQYWKRVLSLTSTE